MDSPRSRLVGVVYSWVEKPVLPAWPMSALAVSTE